jgi:hypothetical protein
MHMHVHMYRFLCIVYICIHVCMFICIIMYTEKPIGDVWGWICYILVLIKKDS